MKYINNNRSARTSFLSIFRFVLKVTSGLGWVIAIALLMQPEAEPIIAGTPEYDRVCIVTADVQAGQTFSEQILDTTQILTQNRTSDMISSCQEVDATRPLLINVAANSIISQHWFAPKESLSSIQHEAVTNNKIVMSLLASDFHVIPSEVAAKQKLNILKAGKTANSSQVIGNQVEVLAIQQLSDKDALITFALKPVESTALGQSLASGEQLHLIYAPNVTPTPTTRPR